jgi:hypothetical protein
MVGFLIRSVCVFYVFYTLLFIFSAIKTPIEGFFIGAFFMWLFYGFYYLGFRSSISLVKVSTNSDVADKWVLCFLLSVISLVCSVYAARYYTGKGIYDVISGLDNYNTYQMYFNEMNLAVFSFNKIPAILSLFIVKVSLVYVLVTCSSKSVNKINCLSVLFVISSHIYLSIARGTSFEVFELLLLFIFIFFVVKSYAFKDLFFTKVGVSVLLCVLLALFVYLANISTRYAGGEVDLCMAESICYDENSFLATSLPSLAKLSVKLSGYFSFGIYYLNELFISFLSVDIDVLVSILLPGIFIYESGMVSGQLCKEFLDCGASWSPEFENLLYINGVFITLVFAFILGRLVRYLYSNTSEGTAVNICALYFIYLYIISLPVGNFLTTSSANILSLIFFSALIVWRIFKYNFLISRGNCENSNASN